jgi:N-acyl homoserine lactone hydrolase
MMVTKKFNDGTVVHGISTGTVAVKTEHYRYSGGGLLRIPKILFGKEWVPAMPIWTWLVETGHGNYLIDTGESVDFYDPNHFSSATDNYVNRRVARVNISRDEEIDRQLNRLGRVVEDIDVVILTHLHIDHIDGVKHFPHARFLVSRKDWHLPLGVPRSVFPSWFKPEKIDYYASPYFEGRWEIAPNLEVVATPGHTPGHQSVLLKVDDFSIMLAGDTTFNEEQLRDEAVGGINMQIQKSRETLRRIKQFGQEAKLIYLPSHDPQAGQRLSDTVVSR